MCSSFFAAYYVIVGGLGNDLERAAFLGIASDRARHPLPVLRARRDLPAGLALCHRDRRARDRRRLRRVGGSSPGSSWSRCAARSRFPSSVFALDAIFATVLVGGARLGFRVLVEWRDGQRARADRVAGPHRRCRAAWAGASPSEVRETPGTGDRRIPRRQPRAPWSKDRGPARPRVAERGRAACCSRATRPRSSSRSPTRPRTGSAHLNTACTNAGVYVHDSCTGGWSGGSRRLARARSRRSERTRAPARDGPRCELVGLFLVYAATAALGTLAGRRITRRRRSSPTSSR